MILCLPHVSFLISELGACWYFRDLVPGDDLYKVALSHLRSKIGSEKLFRAVN